MNKKEFLKLFEENSERFIPGIFNYCDRWCERCTMTDRCGLYATERESMTETPEELSLDGNKLWDHLENMMTLVKEMILDFAEENDIDLDSVPADEIMAEREEVRKQIDDHPLSKISLQYVDNCKTWFDTNRGSIDALEEELNQKTSLEIGMEETLDQAKEIKDYLEVIQWYQFQIHVKIKRALLPDMFEDEYTDPVQNDSNGSAKVALLGTNRSVAAWYGLLKYLPQHEDDILSLLVLLERTRNGIENSFPNVHHFSRPGFDEGIVN